MAGKKEKDDVSHTVVLASHVLTACDNVHLLGGEQDKLCTNIIELQACVTSKQAICQMVRQALCQAAK